MQTTDHMDYFSWMKVALVINPVYTVSNFFLTSCLFLQFFFILAFNHGFQKIKKQV